MKLLVKLMVVVLVALLSVPALAGRGSSGRSGGFSHSGAHFSGGRHFVSGGHFFPGRRVFRSTTVFLGVGIPFYAYYPPPLPYYYDYPPAYYPAPPQQGCRRVLDPLVVGLASSQGWCQSGSQPISGRLRRPVPSGRTTQR